MASNPNTPNEEIENFENLNPDEYESFNEDDEEIMDEKDALEIEDIIKNQNLNESPMEIDEDTNQNKNNDIIPEEDEGIKYEYPDFKAKGEIYSLGFIQNKGIAVIGDGEDTTTFYNVVTKNVIKAEKFNKESVNIIKISADNKYIATASVDGSVNIFDGANIDDNNITLLYTISDQDAEISWGEWHPTGPCLSFGTMEGSVFVYMANNIMNKFEFYSHTEPCTCGSFTQDGKYLISGSEDMTTRVYDLKNQSVLFTLKGKKYHKSPIGCLALPRKPNKKIFACGSATSELSIGNYENGSIGLFKDSVNSSVSIESIQFCNDDKFVVYCDSGNKAVVFDGDTSQIRSNIEFKEENGTKLVVSGNRNYEIFASSTNGNFYLIDVRGNGSVTSKEKIHTNVIMDYVVTKDEKFVLTSSLDGTINLVNRVDLE